MTFSAAAFYLAYLGLAVLHRHRQRQKGPQWANKVSVRSGKKEHKIAAVAGSQHPPKANK